MTKNMQCIIITYEYLSFKKYTNMHILEARFSFAKFLKIFLH